MPSHIRSALTVTSLSIPLRHRELALGTWQGLYLFEHRDVAHTREVMLHHHPANDHARPACTAKSDSSISGRAP